MSQTTFSFDAVAEEPKTTVLSVSPQQKRLFIIDAYGLIYRSYFAFINRPLKDKEGRNVSAVFGFFNTLLMLFRDYRPDYLVVAMDMAGPTFRHELFPEYKANRDAAPEDLHEQVPRIERILEAVGIPRIGIPGIEADDIIATLTCEATRQGIFSVMVSGDKDLMQLINGTVSELKPPRKGEQAYRMMGPDDVLEELNIRVDQIVDYLSLVGDSADNVPGVKGIGEKGAVKLLQEFGSLDGIYEHLDDCSKGIKDKLEAGKELAYLSQTLVALRCDAFTVPSFDVPDYSVDAINWKLAIPLFEEVQARALISAVNKLGEAPVSPVVVLPDPVREKSGGDYQVVTSVAQLEAELTRISSGGLVAFDTETTSLDEMTAKLVGFSFSDKSGSGWYVPLVAGGVEQLDEQSVKRVLKSFLENGRLSLIGQNLKYDYKILRRWGITPARLESDTMLAAWLLDSGSGAYGMDKLARRYLNLATVSYDQVVKKGENFSDVPLKEAAEYSAEDSDITWRLYQYFKPLLDEKNLATVLSDLEIPLIPILSEMEMAGVKLDVKKLEAFGSDVAHRLAIIEETIYREVGREFNINSPKQLQEILFVDRNLPTGKKNKTGFSTDTATLEMLAELDPVADLILQHRSLAKLQNTYIETLPKLINNETGRIHTSFLQTGTATGRLSSRNPNLQNIPIRNEDGRKIRDAFVPENGSVFLSADYSQIELVVLAHVADDSALKAAFLSGEDVHAYTASLIFNTPVNLVTPDQRRVAKTINFGVMYGMSAFRLAGELKISRKEAQEFIDAYFARYSSVKEFIERTKRLAEETGEVSTLFGRIRSIPEIRSSNRVEKAGAERAIVNSVIQGTAADIMKRAMITISKKMKDMKVASRLLLQVHDELIFEVPNEEIEMMKQLVRHAMEGAAQLSIPLKVSLETGMSWGEMH